MNAVNQGRNYARKLLFAADALLLERNDHRSRRRREVAKLKQQHGENMLKFGTGELDRTLIARTGSSTSSIWVFPVLAGGGQRLIEGIDPTHLKLVDTETFTTGIVVHVCAPK